ncbi:MAG: zinc-binding dehydrogenase [Planctomycetaceae bacterium]|nr:zinc-binding dehydrogenase [Planctomycetaceae bacterium]
MFAGQMNAPGRVELVDIPEPELPTRDPSGPGQILFQPTLSCLCGSDLPFFQGSDEFPIQEGHSLHEMIGTVVATNGEKFKSGDEVLAVPIDQRGLYERYLVDETRVIPVDKRVPGEHALLAQPLGTVIYALKKLPNVLDLDFAVVGQGPIGQLYNMALSNMGARQVIGVDLLPSRLAHSVKLGATATVCNAEVDAVEAVAELTGGRMVDVVIEVVGHADQAINLCISLARQGGRMLYFGVPPEILDGVRWRDLFLKNLTVHTSVNPDFERDFPLAMRWIGEGRVDVSGLVTHRFPIHEIQQAFEMFNERREGCLKVFLDYPGVASA